MKEQSPVGLIWELGKKEHGKLIMAVILARARRCLRYGAILCGGKNHFAVAWKRDCIFGLSAVAAYSACRIS